MLSEWLFVLLAHSCNLGAQLADAMASRFSDGVVVGLRLADIELTHLISVFANYLFPLLSKHLPPSVIAVHSDAFSHVVAIEAHFGNELSIMLIQQTPVACSCQVEWPGAEAGSVSHLRPVVRESR